MSYDVRKIDEELASCELSFKEQCIIVYEGIKKGVKHDGCTGAPAFNFGICCAEHDTYYQLATVPRRDADNRLRKCILKKGVPYKLGPIPYNSNWFLAGSYWLMVSLFGWKFYDRNGVGKQGERNARTEIADVDRDLSGPG